MASKDFAILDIQNDDDELQFQDFGLSGNNSSSGHGNGQTHVFTDFPDSPGHQADTDKLLAEYADDEESTGGSGAAPSTAKSFWSFEYYQQFFDVDSKQVGDRIMWSMIPKPGVNYLELHVRPKPDLYGPFWVCLTLVFSAAIAGNVSNYLQTQGDQTLYWRYDFHKVSLAAGMVFSYGWLLPLLLWSALRYKWARPSLSLLELVCLYGYSLSVLVPVCIVWTVPIVWLRWCVGIVGVVLSGLVLAKAVWEGMRSGEAVEEVEGETEGGGVMRKVAMVMLVVVVVMHVAIAMGFMLYFFSEPGGQYHAPLAVLDTSSGPSPPAANVDPTHLPSVVKDITPTKRDVNSRLRSSSPLGSLAAGGERPAVGNLRLSEGNTGEKATAGGSQAVAVTNQSTANKNSIVRDINAAASGAAAVAPAPEAAADSGSSKSSVVAKAAAPQVTGAEAGKAAVAGAASSIKAVSAAHPVADATATAAVVGSRKVRRAVWKQPADHSKLLTV